MTVSQSRRLQERAGARHDRNHVSSANLMRRRHPAWHLPAYAGGLVALSAYAADHYLDIRKWKRVKCQVPTQDAAIDLNLRARTRPPPIGCMEWPGGRVLLQWALDVADLGANTSGTVLEIGSGIGLTAIGLALVREQSGSAQPQPVLATDVCDASLKLLSNNKRGFFRCRSCT